MKLWFTSMPEEIKELKVRVKKRCNDVKAKKKVGEEINSYPIIDAIRNDETSLREYLAPHLKPSKKAHHGAGDIYNLNAETLLRLGEHLKAAERFEDAGDEYMKAKKNRKAKDAYLEAGKQYRQHARNVQQSREYVEVGESYEKSYEAYDKADAKDEALSSLQQAATPYFQVARGLADRGKLEEALEYAKKADEFFKQSKGHSHRDYRRLIEDIEATLGRAEPPEPKPPEPAPPDPPVEIHLIGEAERVEIEGVWRWESDNPDVEILFSRKACRGINEHAHEHRNVEVGGVLIGDVLDFGDGKYQIQINDFFEGKFIISETTEMTFTHETWAEIDKELRRLVRENPRLKIVGWYHTHPGLDIFLSDKDLHIHENFFNEPWHVALVVDPKQDLGGFFTWRRDQTFPNYTAHQFTVSEIYQRPKEIPQLPAPPETRRDVPQTPAEHILAMDKADFETGENPDPALKIDSQETAPPELEEEHREEPLTLFFLDRRVLIFVLMFGVLVGNLFMLASGVFQLPFLPWAIAFEVGVTVVAYVCWMIFRHFRQRQLQKSPATGDNKLVLSNRDCEEKEKSQRKWSTLLAQVIWSLGKTTTICVLLLSGGSLFIWGLFILSDSLVVGTITIWSTAPSLVGLLLIALGLMLVILE